MLNSSAIYRLATFMKLEAKGNDLRLIEETSGAVVATLPHHAFVYCWAVSPDGRLLATGAGDWCVRLWDVQEMQLIAKLSRHMHIVNCLAFSSCGRFLASGGQDKAVHVWEMVAPADGSYYTGAAHRGEMIGHTGPVKSVGFNDAGTLIASGSADKTVRVWRSFSNSVCEAAFPGAGVVTHIVFSPDNRIVACSAAPDRVVRFFACPCAFPLPPTGRQPPQPAPVAAYSQVSAGSSRSRHLPHSPTSAASGSSPGTAGSVAGTGSCLWQVSDLPMQSHVVAAAISLDGRFIAAQLSETSDTFVWEHSTGRAICAGVRFPATILSVALSSVDSARFVAFGLRAAPGAAQEQRVAIWDAAQGATICTLADDDQPPAASPLLPAGEGDSLDVVTSLTVSADGRYVATVSSTGASQIWDLSMGGELRVRRLLGFVGQVATVAASEDGRFFLCGNLGGSLGVWDAESGRCIALLPHSSANASSVPAAAVLPASPAAGGGSIGDAPFGVRSSSSAALSVSGSEASASPVGGASPSNASASAAVAEAPALASSGVPLMLAVSPPLIAATLRMPNPQVWIWAGTDIAVEQHEQNDYHTHLHAYPPGDRGSARPRIATAVSNGSSNSSATALKPRKDRLAPGSGTQSSAAAAPATPVSGGNSLEATKLTLLQNFPGLCVSLLPSCDARHVAASADSGVLGIWEMSGAQLSQNVAFLSSFTGRLLSFCLSRTKDYIVGFCDDAKIRVWTTESGACAYCSREPLDLGTDAADALEGDGRTDGPGILSDAVSAEDGRYVLVTFSNGAAYLCRTPELGHALTQCRLLPAALPTEDPAAAPADARRGATLESGAFVTYICGSVDDGRWVAVGTSHGHVRLYDSVSGSLLCSVMHPATSDEIVALAFSANNRYLGSLGRPFGHASIFSIEASPAKPPSPSPSRVVVLQMQMQPVASLRCADPGDLSSVVQCIADLADDRICEREATREEHARVCYEYDERLASIGAEHAAQMEAVRQEHANVVRRCNEELADEQERHRQGVEELKNVIRHKEMQLEQLKQAVADLQLQYDHARGVSTAGLSSRRIVELQQQSNASMRLLREAFVMAMQDETHTALEDMLGDDPATTLESDQIRKRQKLAELSTALAMPLSPSYSSVSGSAAGSRSSPRPRVPPVTKDRDTKLLANLAIDGPQPGFKPTPLDVSDSHGST